jgi:hypothetical protein
LRDKAPECIRTDKLVFSSINKMTHSYPVFQGGKNRRIDKFSNRKIALAVLLKQVL